MRTGVWVAIVALASGCAREHLTETHGRASREIFARQAANPTPSPKGAPPPAALKGLDSQEATIIAESFRRSLVPKGERLEEPPVLLVGPRTGNQPQRPLPPSVPKQ